MSLPKLNEQARQIVLATIEAERAVGDRRAAAAIEMLLLVHDRAHAQAPPPQPATPVSRETQAHAPAS